MLSFTSAHTSSYYTPPRPMEFSVRDELLLFLGLLILVLQILINKLSLIVDFGRAATIEQL